MSAIRTYANNNLIPYVCTYLIPIAVTVYFFFKSVRAYLVPHFIAIFITGISDVMSGKKAYWIKLATVIGHSPLLIVPLIWKSTPVPHLLVGIGILYVIAASVIIGIPMWNYVLTRKQFIRTYTISLLIVILILSQCPQYYPL